MSAQSEAVPPIPGGPPVPSEVPANPAPDATIEAEADDYNDGDSAIADSALSSTDSIHSSILNYRRENGRQYHGYKDGKYVFPNDEEENDRLDLQHHMFLLTFAGKLFTAPIPKDQQLHRVLDVGTGTGIWAIDFGKWAALWLNILLIGIQPMNIPNHR